MKSLGTQVGVASKHLPILVASDQRDLGDLKYCLEQAASPFMAKVVKMQVRYSQSFAGSGERRAR